MVSDIFISWTIVDKDNKFNLIIVSSEYVPPLMHTYNTKRIVGCWYKDGKLHRLDGPAITGIGEYWYYNDQIDHDK
jgi:hypothetical protein